MVVINLGDGEGKDFLLLDDNFGEEEAEVEEADKA
jgi:hypothetical protein